jgi:hypothetical protein
MVFTVMVIGEELDSFLIPLIGGFGIPLPYESALS